MSDAFLTIVFLVYVIAGYWAVGETIYANKIVFHKFGDLFLQKLIIGMLLGVFLIPAALIKRWWMNR